MRCEEAGEWVSALGDGEVIPRAAAEHMGTCAARQERVRDYAAMGAELRRVASLEAAEEVPRKVWGARKSGGWATWWQKGWEGMRIPRLAFAGLVAAVVVLGSGLAVIRARASSEKAAILLKVDGNPGGEMTCGLSVGTPKGASCSMRSATWRYQIRILSQDGERATLGIRAVYRPQGGGGSGLPNLDSLPEQSYTFEPGTPLQVTVAGGGTLTITGAWMDQVIPLAGENDQLTPKAGELRIVSPMVLRGKEVVDDMRQLSANIDDDEMGVQMYFPGEGRFLVSLSPMPNGVEGKVFLNRITFDWNGETYTVLTGAPATPETKVWVRYDADYRPAEDAGVKIIRTVRISDLANGS